MNDCPRLPADRRGKTEEQKQAGEADREHRENKVVHTTYRKIAFKNGYYDCDKKALRDYNRDVYFLMKGSIDFEESDECVRQEVWDKLFMGVFGTEEVSKYMLQSFARAMAGEIKDKRLFFIIGEPNTRSRRSFVSYSPPSSTPSTLRISVPRRVLPSQTNIWFRGGTNASPFSTRPPEPGVRVERPSYQGVL